MTTSVDFSWMRVVMRSLFDERSITDARAAIDSPIELDKLRSDLQERVLASGRLGRIPAGDFGDNLLLAMLALRTKFDEREAFDKLEVNIAMREKRPVRTPSAQGT